MLGVSEEEESSKHEGGTLDSFLQFRMNARRLRTRKFTSHTWSVKRGPLNGADKELGIRVKITARLP